YPGAAHDVGDGDLAEARGGDRGDDGAQQTLALRRAHLLGGKSASASGQSGLAFVSTRQNTLLSPRGHALRIAKHAKVRTRTLEPSCFLDGRPVVPATPLRGPHECVYSNRIPSERRGFLALAQAAGTLSADQPA